MDELVSGLYELRNEINLANPTPIPQPASSQELRLDVDGRYPLMRASGTFSFSIASRTHWIANLTNTSLNSWTGEIWYKDGDTVSFPYTNVNIEVQRSQFPDQRSAAVTFDDPAPDAWVNRMRFWTAVHEMGHAFNQAHSWQKAFGTGWICLTKEPEALSFMGVAYLRDDFASFVGWATRAVPCISRAGGTPTPQESIPILCNAVS